MNITVYGKHIKIGESLEKHIIDHLTMTVKKYFKDALNAHVTIEKQGQLFETEIIVNEGTGTGTLIKRFLIHFYFYTLKISQTCYL